MILNCMKLSDVNIPCCVIDVVLDCCLLFVYYTTLPFFVGNVSSLCSCKTTS